jgi:hypothetical protein
MFRKWRLAEQITVDTDDGEAHKGIEKAQQQQQQ